MIEHLLFLFQVFAGNTDRFTIVSHDLENPIITKFIRILPITWQGYVSLRAEFYGCREGEWKEIFHTFCQGNVDKEPTE